MFRPRSPPSVHGSVCCPQLPLLTSPVHKCERVPIARPPLHLCSWEPRLHTTSHTLHAPHLAQKQWKRVCFHKASGWFPGWKPLHTLAICFSCNSLQWHSQKISVYTLQAARTWCVLLVYAGDLLNQTHYSTFIFVGTLIDKMFSPGAYSNSNIPTKPSYPKPSLNLS